MRLALDAIQRSGTGSHEDVVKALFDTKDRESVLGTYSIDENGDTTLTDYGVYSIAGGTLKFDSTIKAQTGARSALTRRLPGVGRNSRPRRRLSERVPLNGSRKRSRNAPPPRVRRCATSSRSTV